MDWIGLDWVRKNGPMSKSVWFRLGFCPRPRWGAYLRSPRPLSWISGACL